MNVDGDLDDYISVDEVFILEKSICDFSEAFLRPGVHPDKS